MSEGGNAHGTAALYHKVSRLNLFRTWTSSSMACPVDIPRATYAGGRRRRRKLHHSRTCRAGDEMENKSLEMKWKIR